MKHKLRGGDNESKVAVNSGEIPWRVVVPSGIFALAPVLGMRIVFIEPAEVVTMLSLRLYKKNKMLNNNGLKCKSN